MGSVKWNPECHPFTLWANESVELAICRHQEADKMCALAKSAKRHAGNGVIFLEVPSDTEEVKAVSPFSEIFQAPKPSPLTLQPFESEAACAVIAHSESVLTLVRQKNRAYQDAWKEQGYMGNLARIQSKTARLKNMLWRDATDKDWEDNSEPVMDTLLDLMALCAFALTNLEESNRWGS